MLTRLKIKGFKNLVDVDISFGPFTCIAGPNGSGKSNLFDVIKLLSDLANDTLVNSAIRIRDEHGKTSNIRNIFHKTGEYWADTIEIEAEMLIPKEGFDDLGQLAKANSTFVKYSLSLRYRGEEFTSPGALEITKEELTHITVNDSPKHLRFNHSASVWRNSVVLNKRTTPYISTDCESGNVVINLRQEGRHGRPRSFLAKNLPRTILSTVNAMESPTSLLARREMQSWRLLQLEPSALREPDNFSASPGMATTGAHLPITLFSLANIAEEDDKQITSTKDNSVYDQVSFNLNRLLDDVRSVRVVRDTQKELYTLEVADMYGTFHPARSLSDGTLRFLALAALKVDPKSTGLLCLEEPENGIHPERIPAILGLLQELSIDPFQPVSRDNPLRQVIVNTHSPSVVTLVDDDSLIVSHSKEIRSDGKTLKTATFSWLSGTWRAEAEPTIRPVSPGRLLSYLNPFHSEEFVETSQRKANKRRLVKERPEFQLLLPLEISK
jgi:predicted ATPase